MARQPGRPSDLEPTLYADGQDMSGIGRALTSNAVPPRTARSPNRREPQRVHGQTRTHAHAHAHAQAPSASTGATTGATSFAAVSSAAPAPVPIITATLAASAASAVPAAPVAPAAPTSASTAASSSASRRARAADRRARNISVASDNLDTSEFVNFDLSKLQVDSDSDDFDLRPSRRPTTGPSHSRSMSNPFPSLFSPKKKKHHGGHRDSSSSGQDEPRPPLPVRPRNELASVFGTGSGNGFLAPSSASHGRKPTYATGPCITCGSLMRWVQGVEAFRCGICLTVNDLVPAAEKTARAGTKDAKNGQDSHSINIKGATAEDAPVGPISVEEIRSIIEACLRAYLEAVLCNVPARPRDPVRHEQAQQPAPRSLTGDARLGRPHGQPNGQPNGQPSTLSKGKGRVDWTPAPEAEAAPQEDTPQKPEASWSTRHSRSLSSNHMPQRPLLQDPFQPFATHGAPIPSAGMAVPEPGAVSAASKQEVKEAKKIFRPLEDYIVSHVFSIDSLDSSFLPAGQAAAPQTASGSRHRAAPPVPEVDRGGKAENMSSWWSSAHGRGKSSKSHHTHQSSEGRHKGASSSSAVPASSSRPILIDWDAVHQWYSLIINSGATWEVVYTELVSQGKCPRQPRFLLEQMEAQILKGQEHAQRMLLKAIETVLKRPGRRIRESGDFRFLIVALANPLLQASCKPFAGNYQRDGYPQHPQLRPKLEAGRGTGPAAGQHSVIIKRILGLMANSPEDWHSRMISCFAQFSETRFHQTKDLVGGFLAYRLVRYNEKKEEAGKKQPDLDSNPLVPKIAEGASAASFHAALSQATGSTKTPKQAAEKKMTHGDDWQIKAAVRVLGFLFAANNLVVPARRGVRAGGEHGHGLGHSRTKLKGQIVPTSDFYITLLDNSDLVGDFEAWEQQTAKFSFCQYPFLLSVWAKIQILEYEARRQMKNKARDAFFDSIMTHRSFDQHLVLNVRRECLVEDSLKGVSAAIGSGTEDIKKGLRIIFKGEEGIDAGGLRKEWFLLLVREVFSPDHGMFVYDEESQYCYFNPASFETSDQFFLVGVVLGLAIYNSTILDVALPPFAFRKLLLAAPGPASGLAPGLASGPASGLASGLAATAPRTATKYTLADLAEYRPSLARGLEQLLRFDGDVESTFGLDFTITTERYGHTDSVPLCPGGETRAVTNANREEYVGLYVQYLLDTAVFRQFEPFKRGFFTVCGCNALGLFRPEEIELLVRGSDEPLDVASLRLAATYENWPSANPREDEPTVRWLWELLGEASAQDQRKLLVFITGSDRIPATGPASLSIRVLCLGDDTGRFPTARTCFNTITLYRYASKEAMRERLWGAVNESEGFGLK